MVDIREDPERSLAITETQIDSKKGKKRLFNSAFVEVLNTTQGNERRISHSNSCHIHMCFLPNFSVVNPGKLICSLAELQTKTITRVFFDVFHPTWQLQK